MLCDMEFCGERVGCGKNKCLYLYGSGDNSHYLCADLTRKADFTGRNRDGTYFDRVVPIRIQKLIVSMIFHLSVLFWQGIEEVPGILFFDKRLSDFPADPSGMTVIDLRLFENKMK